MNGKTLFQRFVASLMAMLMAMPVKAAEVVTYFHNDVSGSPMMATDASGAVLWKETYKPYGDKVNRQPASAANKIGFHGKPFDDNSGLSYMSARYYDPVIGRFMGIDPVDFQEDNLHSFNRYAYANNNPYKYVDPDGRFAFMAIIPEILTALGVIGTATRIISAISNGGDNRTGAEKDAGKPPPSPRSGGADTGGADGGGQPRAGESGGPGAGKDFGDKTKDEIRERDGNICVFCKRETTRKPGPDQSNIDHANPKADGGNNTPNNGQNTCRTCNLDKGRRTTGEFLETGGRRLPPQYGGRP